MHSDRSLPRNCRSLVRPLASISSARNGDAEVESSDAAAPNPSPELASTSETDELTASVDGSRPQHPLFASSSTRRKLAACAQAEDAMEAVVNDLGESGAAESLTEQDWQYVMTLGLERGNAALALSIYDAMCRSNRSVNGSSIDRDVDSWAWPPASLDTVVHLVVGLARALEVQGALSVLDSIRRRNAPKNDEVPFGVVVTSPLPPCRPLAVVQPQEGARVVADSETRYEFELFSGMVDSSKSEALPVTESLLQTLTRSLLRQRAMRAVHEMVVRTPAGIARTFRFATETAEIPAQEGNRVTVVAAPPKDATQTQGLLSSAPPNTAPGQPLSVTNHATGVATTVLKPPAGSGAAAGPPSWLLPAAVLLAGSDMASGLIDPNLPALIALGAVSTPLALQAGRTLVVPQLKRLPSSSSIILVESARQKLLAQHNDLTARLSEVVQESSELVRTVARLSQLQNKMAAVGSTRSYDTRQDRVTIALAGTEKRLAKRLQLMEGYAKVVSMIEIEVEMDTQMPQAEMIDIEMQINRLGELEELQRDWQLQAEAQDEVERLLRQ